MQLRPGARLRVNSYYFYDETRGYAVAHVEDPVPPKAKVGARSVNPIARIQRLKDGETYSTGNLVFYGKWRSYTFREDNGMMGYSYE